jgi:hypothetical protein
MNGRENHLGIFAEKVGKKTPRIKYFLNFQASRVLFVPRFISRLLPTLRK